MNSKIGSMDLDEGFTMEQLIHLNQNGPAWAQLPPEGQEYYGFHRIREGWVYREWAPGASRVMLAGDFNGWDWNSHPLFTLGNGNWVLLLPGKDALWNGCKVQVCVDGKFCVPRYTLREDREGQPCGAIREEDRIV